MPFAWRRFISRGCAVALLAVSAGCHQSSEPNSGKPVIAVSIFPVANLVEQLTNGWAEVVTLLPPTASEHTAELTPDQTRLVARADLVIVVGMGLDPWAEKAAETVDSKRMTVLRFSDLTGAGDAVKNAPDELAHDRAVPNNHLWLDPVLAGKFVEALSSQFKRKYPQHEAAIDSAADRLRKDLHEIDRQYAEQLAAVPQRELITFHNAFDLIAERYQLKIVVHLTDIELSPGGEVTLDRIREALEAIRKQKLRVLYAETEFPSQVIERLHEETGVDVLQLDPHGNPAVEGYRTYQEMMRSNLKTLVKGQSE